MGSYDESLLKAPQGPCMMWTTTGQAGSPGMGVDLTSVTMTTGLVPHPSDLSIQPAPGKQLRVDIDGSTTKGPQMTE